MSKIHKSLYTKKMILGVDPKAFKVLTATFLILLLTGEVIFNIYKIFLCFIFYMLAFVLLRVVFVKDPMFLEIIARKNKYQSHYKALSDR